MTDAALSPPPKIRTKKRGNALGIWFFEILLKTAGLRSAYWLLEPVCTYYWLVDREAVTAAMAYMQRRFPASSRLRNYFRIQRLFVSQGKQLIDRNAVFHRPDFFTFREEFSPEALQVIHESPQGLVLLLSHAGNWQVALRQMGHLKKNICIVMRPEDNPAVQEALHLGEEAKPVRIINPEGYLGGVLEIMQALEEGAMVCMMGDRAYNFDTVTVPFLGEAARFPYGAFSVAAAAGCPVVPFLTHKISEREYTVDITRVWRPVYNRGAAKRDQLARWVAEYAGVLEGFTEKHPYECFLFHNVWTEEKESQ